MTNSVSEPAFPSVPRCLAQVPSHILFRVFNALKYFESPLVFARGADLSLFMMYVPVHGPDEGRTGTPYAAPADSYGSHTGHNGTITGEQRRGQDAPDGSRPRAWSAVAWQSRWRSGITRTSLRGISSRFWRPQDHLPLTRPAITTTLTCLMPWGMIKGTPAKPP